MSQPQLKEYFGIIPIRRCSGLPTDALTLENTKVLLNLENTVHLPFWCCPRGHAELGDKGLLEVALGVLQEETGLEVKEENVLSNITIYQDGTKMVTYYIGIVSAGEDAVRLESQKTEVESASWSTFAEAVKSCSSNNTKNLLRRVMIDVFQIPVETLNVEIEDESFGIIPIAVQPLTPESEKTKIATANTKVLLIQQKTFDVYVRSKLHWALPKGHREVNDNSPIATAVRELREETGLVLKFVWEDTSYTMTYWTPFKQCWKKVTLFLGVVDQQQELVCEDTEVNEARFMSWEEAELISSEQVKGLLKQVIDRLDNGEVYFHNTHPISSSHLRADTGDVGL